MQRRVVLPLAPAVLGAMVALAACGFTGLGTGPAEPAPDAGNDAAPVTLDGSMLDAAVDNDVPLPPPDPRPSHLSDLSYDEKAFDVSGLTAIDTGTPGTATANPSTTPPLPVGARFEIKASDTIAVMIIGGWNVDKPIAVRGARSLIVVAARPVTILAAGSIDAGGKGETPGPGGFGFGVGDGRGKNGAAGAGDQDSGGGGGSFGSLGAAGGATVSGTAGGAAGNVYGDNPALFLGGSPGGEGSPINNDCRPRGTGGGGGGAIQISALVSINVAAGAFINAGGGGGRGGCSDTGKAGGGGGSGGTIFLESQDITVAGTLAANGGAGGGGGSGDFIIGFDAQSGENAGVILPNIDAARGGSNPAQGAGGDGAIEGTVATKGQTAAGENNQGGGGGGMGRIWLRTFGVKGAAAKAPVTTGAKISPTHKIAP